MNDAATAVSPRDHAPAPFLIPEVELDIDLVSEDRRTRSVCHVRPRAGAIGDTGARAHFGEMAHD